LRPRDEYIPLAQGGVVYAMDASKPWCLARRISRRTRRQQHIPCSTSSALTGSRVARPRSSKRWHHEIFNLQFPISSGLWYFARLAAPERSEGGLHDDRGGDLSGIIGFALVAIIGVLPLGMNTQRDNREETSSTRTPPCCSKPSATPRAARMT